MKKYILAAALVLVSANAMAERIVSGTTGKGDKFGGSQDAACSAAKDEALKQRSYNEQVKKYFACECKQNEKGLWSCSVDAALEKVR
jgi:hypothetical protein